MNTSRDDRALLVLVDPGRLFRCFSSDLPDLWNYDLWN